MQIGVVPLIHVTECPNNHIAIYDQLKPSEWQFTAPLVGGISVHYLQ